MSWVILFDFDEKSITCHRNPNLAKCILSNKGGFENNVSKMNSFKYDLGLIKVGLSKLTASTKDQCKGAEFVIEKQLH